ncbi:Halomucin [Papilio machaon]|uniref:Halomucin n=1 Tax=Papilio machaon TaxID=76193 RepID=A0A194QR90_PAPMA|nr:Halomucin [Papilio machaon]
MHRSKIPSPARSEGAKVTPRRHRFRSSRSVSSPARSDVSVKLSSIVQMHAMQSPLLSPLKTRRSVLSDNTDIEVPGRQSWWKRLEENSRDVMEVFESKTTEQMENIDEYIETDFKSQENNYTLDLPESSDGESINSIVLPQRKFFSQKQTQSNKLFNKIIENRENLTHRKSKANTDNTIFVGKKNFFNKDTEVRRSRPAFPPGLLNMTDKTLINKTHDITKHEQVRNLLGNRAGTKRKNMFADFIMSESEDEIPDIQPNVFGFAKSKQPQRKMSLQGTRNTSPRSNETDLEFDDWQHLPSSTMVDNEFGNTESSPLKRPRLSKPDSVIEEVRGNVRNKLDKTKLTLIMSHGLEDDNELEESDKKRDPKNTHEKTLTQIPETDTARPFIAEIIEVESDDEHNFTLRYDNDDKNMQDDEMDVTVKELEKDNSNSNKNNINTTTDKELKSPRSLKDNKPNANKSVIIEEQEQDKNISWKVLKTHKEQHAAIITREDLVEKDVNKTMNTSISASNNKDACDEIDNPEINIERGNSSINKEKTNSETEVIKHTSNDIPQKNAAIIERIQKDDVMQEEKSKNREDKFNQVEAQQEKNNSIENINEEIQKSVDENMEVDGNINNFGRDLNKVTEQENHNVNNKKDTESHKVTTQIHINDETDKDNHHVAHPKLNEGKEETVKETPISTMQEKTNTRFEENPGAVEELQEENDNLNENTEMNKVVNESNKETRKVAMPSVDANINQADEGKGDDNNENSEVDEEHNLEHSETTNKSLNSVKQASSNENILTDDEDSKHNDVENITEDNETTNKSHEESNKMTSVDENNITDDEDNEEENQVDDEDNAEVSEEQNETNDETDKQAGVSSMDANIESDDDENPEDSDEEDNNENDAEENEITEENDEEMDSELEISSINKSIEMENEEIGANNEEDNAEENEVENESDEGISDRIGMPSMNIETDDEDNNQNNEEMNIEQEINNDSNAKTDNQVTFSKGRIYLTNVTGESTHSYAEEAADSDPEDAQTRQLALEQYLMKIKNDNIEKRRKMLEEVRNSLKTRSREPFNNFKAPARLRPRKPQQHSDVPQQTKTNKKTSLNIENLPPELLDDMKYKPPRRYQPKSAAWITKKLYKYLETKLEPKYDYKARVKAEKITEALYEFSKEIRRQRVASPHTVDVIKLQLARAGLVTIALRLLHVHTRVQLIVWGRSRLLESPSSISETEFNLE